MTMSAEIVLKHLINLICDNRELFHNLVKTEDASLQFLTIQAGQRSRLNDGLSGSTHYNGKLMQATFD